MLHSGERQVAPSLEGIRRDHLARYEWAARTLPPGSRVVDVGCGIGYGAFILARAGHVVTAIDRDAETIAFAGEHYDHPNITRIQADANSLGVVEGSEFDAAVCFELIEHLADPLPLLRTLRSHAPVLLASVPNETHFPWANYAFHHRHYTRIEFETLLRVSGFAVSTMLGQANDQSDVADCEGRTLVVSARRAARAELNLVDAAPANAGAAAAPEHVVILGLGPTVHQYTDRVMRLGGRHHFADEVWAINALGDVLACDRIFHMDQVEIQEIRAAARPDSNIAVMLEWLKTHPGPIYTSIAKVGYPGLVELPIEDMINTLGFAYFNSTAAYAVAYAVYIGVKRISLFGIDFTLPNAHHAEQGRGCVEFWLGIAAARGIELGFADRTSLMDTIHDPKDANELRLYGYDTVKVTVQRLDGAARLTFNPRAAKPTADEIEDRYDHSKHPSALVRQAQGVK